MVLVSYNSFYKTFAGLLGIKCVIRQFLASQDLIVDMIFEWLEILVEVQTERNRESTTKNRKKTPKNTKKKPKKQRKITGKNRTLPQISNLELVFFGFFGLQPPYVHKPCSTSRGPEKAKVVDGNEESYKFSKAFDIPVDRPRFGERG